MPSKSTVKMDFKYIVETTDLFTCLTDIKIINLLTPICIKSVMTWNSKKEKNQ